MGVTIPEKKHLNGPLQLKQMKSRTHLAHTRLFCETEPPGDSSRLCHLVVAAFAEVLDAYVILCVSTGAH